MVIKCPKVLREWILERRYVASKELYNTILMQYLDYHTVSCIEKFAKWLRVFVTRKIP